MSPNLSASRLARLCFVGALLAAPAARAHGGIFFDFLSPDGPMNRPDGGVFTLRWMDVDDEPLSQIRLSAARDGLPFNWTPGAPEHLVLTPTTIQTKGPPDFFDWSVAGVDAGCYQPYATIEDPGFPTQNIRARGLIAVSEAGGPQWPLVAITNPVTDGVRPDGTLDLKVEVDSPELPTSVKLSYRDETGGEGVLVDAILFPPGRHATNRKVDLSFLVPGPYQLLAAVTAEGGRSCVAYWVGTAFVPVVIASDGGVTSARKRISRDAGWLPLPEPPQGCTQSGGLLLSLLGIWTVAALGRRRR